MSHVDNLLKAMTKALSRLEAGRTAGAKRQCRRARQQLPVFLPKQVRGKVPAVRRFGAPLSHLEKV